MRMRTEFREFHPLDTVAHIADPTYQGKVMEVLPGRYVRVLWKSGYISEESQADILFVDTMFARRAHADLEADRRLWRDVTRGRRKLTRFQKFNRFLWENRFWIFAAAFAILCLWLAKGDLR